MKRVLQWVLGVRLFSDVKVLAFGRTGPLSGLAPLQAFAAKG